MTESSSTSFPELAEAQHDVRDLAEAPDPRRAEAPSLAQTRDVLLLRSTPYRQAVASARPARYGALFLLAVLGVLLLARLIGFGVAFLTMPRLDRLQSRGFDLITSLPWYAQQSAQTPDFAQQFGTSYGLAWDGVRAALGYPALSSGMASILSLLMTTFGAWLLYSLFAHGVARWLGGRARFGQILGAIGLAYAPLLLYALEVIPGFVVPAVVVTLFLLATKYLAIRQTYGLDIGYSLVVVLAPYAIGALLLLALVLFGGAIGLSRVPGLDNVFRLLPFLPR